MALTPKEYQKQAINKLTAYLDRARLLSDPALAFTKTFEAENQRAPHYRRVGGLESVPYVCIRIPTGGGKTIVGAYAVRIATKHYIERDYPVVLWLVPTNTIRTQTVDALKKTTHPYREALDAAFDGRVAVFDIAEIDNIRPQDLTERVCIVVGTLQTLRVEKTEGRQVYAHKEAFEDHFARVKPQSPDLERIAEGPDAGKIKFSFANLMMVHHPMVIVDEAHNARTSLTFDVLKRIAPSLILELTATPDTSPRTGSNVLHHVSAAELKSEAMIKLPIVLKEHPQGWEDAIKDSVLTLRTLQQRALGESDFVRPLLLIQAENRDRRANVEAVKRHLIDDELIPADRIAIATGDQRELDGINLFDPKCRIEAIITVQALKEGWDCSFAYVFCSVANISSSKDVEQLLGRVLRMPYARKRKAPQLNQAYAHVSSARFGEAAQALRDRLVNGLGFEQSEADEAIEAPPQLPLDLPLFTQTPATVITLDSAPDLSVLSHEDRKAIVITPKANGAFDVTLLGPISEQLKEALCHSASPERAVAVRRQIDQHQDAMLPAQPPILPAGSLSVPQLYVFVQGEWELAEREIFLEAGSWNLLEWSAKLDNFSYDESSRTFVFDVEGDRITYSYEQDQQIESLYAGNQWTDQSLVRWLDKQLRQEDIRQEVLMEWISHAVKYLMQYRSFELAILVQARYGLMRVLAERIGQCRTQAARRGFQQILFGSQVAVKTTFDHAFQYDPQTYTPRYRYDGPYQFRKHQFGRPGELGPEENREEYECAIALDAQPEVEHWVRNLALKPKTSFCLPTATDKFYPDFMAFLKDGRRLAVEYKGSMLESSADTTEKARVGALWEETSDGRCLFLMATKTDEYGRETFTQIRDKIHTG